MFYNFTTKLHRTDIDLCTIKSYRCKIVHNTSKGVDNEVKSVGKFCTFYNLLKINNFKETSCQNEPSNPRNEKLSEFMVL